MSINWTNVMKTQFFKHGSRSKHAFEMNFSLASKSFSGGYKSHCFFPTFTNLGIPLTRPNFVQVIRDASDIIRNGHVVIVKHNEKIFIFQGSRVSQSFKCHASCDCTIANNCYIFIIRIFITSCHSKSCTY